MGVNNFSYYMPYFKNSFQVLLFSPFSSSVFWTSWKRYTGSNRNPYNCKIKPEGIGTENFSMKKTRIVDNSCKNSWWSSLRVSVCAGCWETKTIRSGFWPWETQRQEGNHCKVYEDSYLVLWYLYDSWLTPTPFLYLPFLPFFSHFLFSILSLR